MKLSRAFFVISGILQMSVYNVYGGQNEFVERVTKIEHSFWACAVLGKMALYDGLPYLR